FFANRYGRKKVMMIISVLFTISSLGCALSQSVFMLAFFRLIAGIAVGAVSVIAPMYISEIAPAEKRGTLVSFNQFAIVIGILLAYVFNYFLIDFVDGWRYMLAIPFVFSMLFFGYLSVSFPESPRWLLSKGKNEEAMAVLIKIGGTHYAKDEMQSMEQSMIKDTRKEKASFYDLFKGRTGKVVLLGTLLAAFQQITGINAVVSYAPIIFEKTGVGGNTASMQSILVGLVNFLATIVALWLVDKKGRKTLLLWGAAGMTLSLSYLTYAFTFNGNNLSIVVALLAYIAFFAASFAPVMWVVTSEIYPNRVRGIALSFSTTISWLCTFVIVQSSPYVLNQFGGAFLFGFFAVLSLLAFVFVKKWIPETKGKSLEEIEREII
ncbi:MAG: sugar porter family MFS transporter, partial [Bacteroidota bacterium]|nr:sugar porter family MFS transporter [Bacteroidota bacterium]